MDPSSSGIDLCMIPAGVPPNDTFTNFENPTTLVPELISISVIMTVGAVFFMTCRLVANRKKLQWSDYFAVIALVCSLGLVGLMLAQTRYARHQWDIRACWYNSTYTKILFSQEIVLTFVLFFSKLAIFTLLFQIFQVHTFMRVAIRIGVVFTALLYFVNIPTSAILSAPHIGETWTSVLFSGRPQKNLIWGVVQAACSIVLDLFIFILPIPTVVKLNLSMKKRLQVLAVFAVASVGVIASALSLVYRVAAIGTNDGTWKYTSLLICSVVESDVAIIVSCAPGFANFMKNYFMELPLIRSIRSSFGKSSRGSSGEFKLAFKKNNDYNNMSDRLRMRNKMTGKREHHEFEVLDDAFENPRSIEEGGFERYVSHTSDLRLPTSSMDELVEGRPRKH